MPPIQIGHPIRFAMPKTLIFMVFLYFILLVFACFCGFHNQLRRGFPPGLLQFTRPRPDTAKKKKPRRSQRSAHAPPCAHTNLRDFLRSQIWSPTFTKIKIYYTIFDAYWKTNSKILALRGIKRISTKINKKLVPPTCFILGTFYLRYGGQPPKSSIFLETASILD